jgi:hypothetical protein
MVREVTRDVNKDSSKQLGLLIIAIILVFRQGIDSFD